MMDGDVHEKIHAGTLIYGGIMDKKKMKDFREEPLKKSREESTEEPLKEC